jgi:ribonuclease P protein component
MRFRPEQHLRRQGDFRAIREKGRRLHCGPFTLWYLPREPATAVRRVGVVASTAAVGPAVQRNRAKRRLREVFRRHQDAVPAGCDLLLVAGRSLNRLAYGEIERKFTEACRQLAPTPHA